MPDGSELEFKHNQTGAYFVNCLNGEEIREKVLSPLQSAFEENLKFLSKSEHTTEEMQMIFTQQAHVQYFMMGDVTMPSGHVVVADPFVQSIAGIRIVGAALTITNAPVVRYVLSQSVGHELAGFGVDAGMCCFADKEAVLTYHTFFKEWYIEHPDGNLYNDFFKERFVQSFHQYPSLQREEGDFLHWNIPKTTYTIAMFSSGLGDGFYSSFWGYDANDQIAQLVVPFMKVDVFLP